MLGVVCCRNFSVNRGFSGWNSLYVTTKGEEGWAKTEVGGSPCPGLSQNRHWEESSKQRLKASAQRNETETKKNKTLPPSRAVTAGTFCSGWNKNSFKTVFVSISFCRADGVRAQYELFNHALGVRDRRKRFSSSDSVSAVEVSPGQRTAIVADDHTVRV